ncbi:MAG: aldo/keto reductase [Geminicoccaceae bacterium]
MEFADLGGARMPLLGLGTYPLQGEEATRTVAEALALGYRHIDTAQMYGNEAAVGAGLRRSGLPRDDLFVVTKVHPDNYVGDRFAGSVQRSLEDLGLAHVDLLLLHWPHESAPFEPVLDALLATLEQGRARFVGVSNFGPADLALAVAHTKGRIACDQVEFHPLLDQSDLQAEARAKGVTLTAYTPLGRGAVLDEPVLIDIARRHGRTVAQVTLRWIVQQGVAAVPMSRSTERLKDNLAVFDFALADDEMAAIGALRGKGRKVVAPAGRTFQWGREA